MSKEKEALAIDYLISREKDKETARNIWYGKQPLSRNFIIPEMTPAECLAMGIGIENATLSSFNGIDTESDIIGSFSFKDAKAKISGIFKNDDDNDSFTSTNKIRLIGGVIALVIILGLVMLMK